MGNEQEVFWQIKDQLVDVVRKLNDIEVHTRHLVELDDRVKKIEDALEKLHSTAENIQSDLRRS